MKLNIQLFASGTITLAKKTGDASWKALQGKITYSESNQRLDNGIPKSDVTVKLYCKTWTSGTSGKQWGGKVVVNGTTVINFSSLSTQKNISSDWVLLATATTTVTHDSDGTKTITISGSVTGCIGTSISGLVSSGSGSVTLDTIPTASTLNSISLGNTYGIFSYNKKNAGYYDVIAFVSNGQTLAEVYNPTQVAGDFTGSVYFDMSKVLAASTAAGSASIIVDVILITYTDSYITTQVGNSSILSQTITLGSSTDFSTTQSISNAGTATITPYFNKWNAGTYCVLNISGGTFNQTFENVSSGTSYTLNSTNLFNAIGTNTNLQVTAELITKSASNGAELGKIPLYPTFTLPNYSINVTSSSTDLNNSVVIGGHPLSYYKPNTNTMIKGLSNPRITYAVSSSTGYLYGRNITTSGAKTQTISTGASTNVVVEPGTNMNASYTLTASDGRKSNSKTESFTLANYFNPSISPIEITRPDGPTAPKFYVSVNGTFFNGTNLTNLSNATLLVQWSNDNNTWNTLGTVNDTDGSIAYSTTYTSSDIDFYKKPVYIKATLTDRIGNQTTLTNNIPPGQPVFNTYKDSAGNNYMRINGDLNVDKEVVVGQIRSKNMFNKNSMVYSTHAYLPADTSNTRLRSISSIIAGIIVIKLEKNKTYTISKKQGNRLRIGFTNTATPALDTDNVITRITTQDNATSKSFTMPSNKEYAVINFYSADQTADVNVGYENMLNSIQIEEGSQATEYFQHQDLNNEISSGSGNIQISTTEVEHNRWYRYGNICQIDMSIITGQAFSNAEIVIATGYPKSVYDNVFFNAVRTDTWQSIRCAISNDGKLKLWWTTNIPTNTQLNIFTTYICN